MVSVFGERKVPMKMLRAMFFGAAVVALLAGAPNASALTPAQEQTLQNAAATGGTVVVSAVRDVVLQELAGGRSFNDVIREVLESLYNAVPGAGQKADVVLAAIQGARAAAEALALPDLPPQTAAVNAAFEALRIGQTSEAFLQELFDRAAASPDVRDTVANAAQAFGGRVGDLARAAGLEPPAEPQVAQPGAPVGPGVGGGRVLGMLGGIAGGGGLSSPDAPGRSDASPN